MFASIDPLSYTCVCNFGIAPIGYRLEGVCLYANLNITLSLHFSPAWLWQHSSWNRNRSFFVCVAIISEPNARISFKIWLLLPLGHTLGRLFKLKHKLRILFVFFTMGPNGSENFRTPLLQQIAAESVFKLFLNFLSNGPHKTMFGIFEILKIEILTICFFVFFNMGPNGSENLKTILLLQMAAKCF